MTTSSCIPFEYGGDGQQPGLEAIRGGVMEEVDREAAVNNNAGTPGVIMVYLERGSHGESVRPFLFSSFPYDLCLKVVPYYLWGDVIQQNG